MARTVARDGNGSPIGRRSAAAGKPKRVTGTAHPKPETLTDVGEAMAALGGLARAAAQELALASTEAKNAALTAAAREMRAQTAAILESNTRDLAVVREGRATPAFLDRLGPGEDVLGRGHQVFWLVCLRISSRAMARLCTSSGPSTMRSVRALA